MITIQKNCTNAVDPIVVCGAVFLFVVALTLVASRWFPLPAVAANQEILHFPREHAVGKLLLLTPARNGETYAESVYSMAQGDVSIAPGSIFLLQVNYEGAKDFSFLKKLPPGVIAGLRIEKLALTDQQFLSIYGLSGLKMLQISDTEVTDQGLARLKECTALIELGIGSSRITGKGLACLHGLPNLNALNLEHNELSDASMANVGALKKLTWLRLRAANIGDGGLAHLKDLPKLRKLIVCSNPRITDAGMVYLAAMPTLRKLDLTDCKVTIKGLMQLKKVTELKNLTVAYRNLGVGQIDLLKHAMPQCNISDGHQPTVPIEVFSPLH